MQAPGSESRLLMPQRAELSIVVRRPVSSGFAVSYKVYRCQQMPAKENAMSHRPGPSEKHAPEDTDSRAWLHGAWAVASAPMAA